MPVAGRARLWHWLLSRARLITLLAIVLLVAVGQVSTARDIPRRVAAVAWIVTGLVAVGGLVLQRLAPQALFDQPLQRRWQTWVALAFMVAALPLLKVGLSVDGFLFAGVLLLIAGIGQLLTEWRNARSRRIAGIAWLVACGVTYAVGLTMLHERASSLAAIAVAGAVLAAPIGVTLLSAAVLNGPLRWSHRRSWSAYLTRPAALVGYALAAGTFVWLALMAGSWHVLPWIALAFAVAGVLLYAIATSWQADIAVVGLVAVAVQVSSPGALPLSEQHGPDPGERVLAALGDSYISGEGADDYFAGTNDKGRNECRRAPTAYMPTLIDESADERQRLLGATDLVFLACSGARGYHLYDSAQGTGEDTPRNVDDGTERTKLHQLAHLRRVETLEMLDVAALVLSIGGNDAGFSTIGMTCLAPQDCAQTGEGTVRQQWEEELGVVAENLDRAYWHVAVAARGRFPVVVVPYPTPLTADGCGDTWLTAHEHEFLYDYVFALNERIKAAARRYNFNVATDVVDSLGSGRSRDPDGLRLCDTEEISEAGINFIGVRTVSGNIEQRLNPGNWLHNSFHPNKAGHERLAMAMRNYLSDPTLELTLPRVPAGRVPESTARPIAQIPCASVPDTEEKDGCDNLAGDWAVRQVAQLLAAITVPIAIALVGLWLVALSVLSGWRARHAPPPDA